jgi:hypothetical protein
VYFFGTSQSTFTAQARGLHRRESLHEETGEELRRSFLRKDGKEE